MKNLNQPTTICFYNNKGGVGKTTLSTSVAFRAIEKNLSLSFIDADKQNNAMKWISRDSWTGEESFQTGKVIVTGNPGSIPENDLVIVDAPPDYNFIKKLPKVDVWVVPVKGRFSVDGAVNVISQLKELNRGHERIVLVSNMTEPNSEIGRKQINEVKSLDVEIFKWAIPRHLSFEKAEDLCVPIWEIPYSVRSSSVQVLQHLTDWILNKCPEKGTYGETIINSRVSKYANY